MNRFQFVADHRDAFEVKRLCEIVQVARSSFYAWLAAAPARAVRASADAALAERIRAIHDSDRAQGVPRITAELNDGADPAARVNHKRVARVMRQRTDRRAAAAPPGPHHVPEPADQTRARPAGPGLHRRRAPNQRYVGDITYLPIADGSNLYLATVIDCYSRRLAGWAVAEHMRTDLIIDALSAARDTRGSLAGAIFHSDHGAQYSSKAFAQLCAELGVTQSMGAVGTSADNALAESFNATLKRETLHGAHCLARRGDVSAGGVPVGDPLQHPPPPLLVRPASPRTSTSSNSNRSQQRQRAHQRQLHQGRCRRREWLERGLRCPKLVCPPCRMTCRFQDVEEVGCRTGCSARAGDHCDRPA